MAYSNGQTIAAGYDSLNHLTSLNDAAGASTFSYVNFGAFHAQGQPIAWCYWATD